MFFAFCGPPLAGKTTAQEILYDEFGIIPIDDGKILRDISMLTFGISENDVTTHDGKSKLINILGEEMPIREYMGRIGGALEREFGSLIVPAITCFGLDRNKNYSFGSVRRDQAKFYKQHGIVIEIKRAGTRALVKHDKYDTSFVDKTIYNNGTLEEFKNKLVDYVRNFL